MIILTIRSDKPEAEIGLFDGKKRLNYITWQAHRELSDTLLVKIEELLGKRSLKDIRGIVVFQGPGSFTGLRIGITVANTLKYSLSVPIVASRGKDWLGQGVKSLQAGTDDRQVLPEYGAEANITKPRK